MTETQWDVELVDGLTKLAQPDGPNRAALAHLRRGLDRPTDYTLGRVGWLFRRAPDYALDNAVLAAGLFAWVKGVCPQSEGVNFGGAFGHGLTADEKKQREKRFIDLLDTDAEELPYKLRQAVTLIARDAVGLDWVLLIRHACHWGHPDRWVQKQWARAFWAASEIEVPRANEQPVSA
jgi:CRISPR system Cascade subunit CasB